MVGRCICKAIRWKIWSFSTLNLHLWVAWPSACIAGCSPFEASSLDLQHGSHVRSTVPQPKLVILFSVCKSKLVSSQSLRAGLTDLVQRQRKPQVHQGTRSAANSNAPFVSCKKVNARELKSSGGVQKRANIFKSGLNSKSLSFFLKTMYNKTKTWKHGKTWNNFKRVSPNFASPDSAILSHRMAPQSWNESKTHWDFFTSTRSTAAAWSAESKLLSARCRRRSGAEKTLWPKQWGIACKVDEYAFRTDNNPCTPSSTDF